MTPRDVLAALPEWRNARVSNLAGGLTNRSWLVEAHGNRAVLKIDDEPREAPFGSRRDEARTQAAAAAAGLAPAVLHATDTVLMTEYLEGEAWSGADLDDDANLERLGAALGRLHALPLTGRSFDARGAARIYAAKAFGTDPTRVKQWLEAIDAMPPPENLRCCHNDLVAGNIVATPAICFVDWEYAADNDPLFDIATLVAHHGLSEERRAALLEAYGAEPGDREKLLLFERGYRGLTRLWQAARAQADVQHEPRRDRR